jgi:hypothetical protein
MGGTDFPLFRQIVAASDVATNALSLIDGDRFFGTDSVARRDCKKSPQK